MMSKLESAIEKAGREKLERAGWKYIKLYNNPGWPDRMILRKPGDVRFIEWKRPGCIPEPLQIYIHNLLKKLGFKVYVFESVKDIPNELTNGRT